jgi:hypothetical protein
VAEVIYCGLTLHGMGVNRTAVRADVTVMTWWEWTIAGVWGPSILVTSGMLIAVAVGKATSRSAHRRPVTIERRQSHRAGLREAIERRGVVVNPSSEQSAMDADHEVSLSATIPRPRL